MSPHGNLEGQVRKYCGRGEFKSVLQWKEEFETRKNILKVVDGTRFKRSTYRNYHDLKDKGERHHANCL